MTVKKTHIHIIILLFAGLMASGQLFAQDKVIRGLRASLWEQPDSISYTKVLNQIGMLYHLSNADSCFWYAIKARDIASRHGDKKGLAGALNNMSIAYVLKANIEQAIAYGYKSLMLYRELDDRPLVCIVLMNLSIYHLHNGMKAEANQLLYQAMSVGKDLKQDSTYSLVLINYAIRFQNDSTRADSVKWALERSKEILNKYPSARQLYYIQAMEADEWMKEGEGAKAVRKINELADKALNEGLEVVAIDMLARIVRYSENGYPADALPALEKAFVIGNRAGYLNLMLDDVAALYRHYGKTNNEAKKAYYGRVLWQLASMRLDEKSSNYMNYLDYFLKEQELDEWQLSNTVQEQKIRQANMKRKNRQQLIGFLSAILVLLMIFTYFRYRAYKNLRHQERLLREMNSAISEKNYQLRIHDDFKNKLIAILARDFREPLNDIIRVSAMFRNKDMDQSSMQQIIDEAVVSSRKTLVIFENILRWIKSQLSGFVYNPAPCDLLLLFEQAMSHVKQQRIKLDIPADLYLAGDQEMLSFINRSLLHCAEELSGGKGTIRVRAIIQEQVKVEISFEVENVTSQMAAHLFEYKRGDDMSVTLVICKDFMDKMGGHISAEVSGVQLRLGYCLPSFN